MAVALLLVAIILVVIGVRATKKVKAHKSSEPMAMRPDHHLISEPNSLDSFNSLNGIEDELDNECDVAVSGETSELEPPAEPVSEDKKRVHLVEVAMPPAPEVREQKTVQQLNVIDQTEGLINGQVDSPSEHDPSDYLVRVHQE